MIILLVLDLNIIFNLLHLSNHFQTLTNFTLDPPSFTVNPLEVAQHKLHTLIHLNSSSPSPSNEPWRRVRGEERWQFLYFSIISVMQRFECDIKITIISTLYFLALLWMWCKNMGFQIIITKIINNENMKIIIK